MFVVHLTINIIKRAEMIHPVKQITISRNKKQHVSTFDLIDPSNKKFRNRI